MSTRILNNRHRRDILVPLTDLDLGRILAAPIPAVLTLSLARTRFCGDALADIDVEGTVVVEDHADGGGVAGGSDVGDGSGVGEGEEGEEGQQEDGEGVHDGWFVGFEKMEETELVLQY
jgi:hypothetical protein